MTWQLQHVGRWWQYLGTEKVEHSKTKLNSAVTLTAILYPQPAVTEKLWCHEIETDISIAHRRKVIFSRCKLVILLELIHLKMEVNVSELCSQAECWYNLEIHTEAYILIDWCSVEARVIISTRSTKFYTVAIFLFAYFQDGRQSLGSNL